MKKSRYDKTIHPTTEVGGLSCFLFRKCCELDFWFVLDRDNELSEMLKDDVEKTGSFNKTYERFKQKYN